MGESAIQDKAPYWLKACCVNRAGVRGKCSFLPRGDLSITSVRTDNLHREARLRRQESAEVTVRRRSRRSMGGD